MRWMLYPRLALTNLKKNKAAYFPYALACSTIIGLYYMLLASSEQVAASDFSGGWQTAYLLQLSTVIAGFVSVLVVFYANSFLMKQRKKELGLYSVLGMEKRHVARVLFCETAVTGAGSIAAGVLGGVVLEQMIFLILLNLLKLPVKLSFFIPAGSVAGTLLLFAVSFLFVMTYNFFQIHLADPIALMQGGRQGEREPKTNAIMTVLGLLALGLGYALALSVRTPGGALMVFFPSVLLVIAGTYLLFTSGSIALLKIMRKNKMFYYQPNHFIAVSGMIYRMKQNAVGLANICILSTCLLVTLSSTVAVYVGEEDLLRNRFPHDVMLSGPKTQASAIEAAAKSHAAEYSVEMKDVLNYLLANVTGARDGNRLIAGYPQDAGSDSICEIQLTALDDYNRLTGRSAVLGLDEILLYTSDETFQGDTLRLGERILTVKERIEQPDYLWTVEFRHIYILVMPDTAAIEGILSSLPPDDANPGNGQMRYCLDFNAAGDEDSIQRFAETLWDTMKTAVQDIHKVEDIFNSRNDFYSLYGTIVFIGLFFVSLFAIATVLIIYYKQISEGYGDRERFQIMQKVGMSDREVKKTIRDQVWMVFFLPLAAAVVHIAVAFPVLCKLMTVFNMVNTRLYFLCTAGVVLVFALFYTAVYQATAKTYYRIVQGER